MYKKPFRTTEEKLARAIDELNFLAEPDKHTLEDVCNEFRLSKRSVQKDIKFFKEQLVSGYFGKKTAVYKLLLSKANHRLDLNKKYSH